MMRHAIRRRIYWRDLCLKAGVLAACAGGWLAAGRLEVGGWIFAGGLTLMLAGGFETYGRK